MASLPRIGPRAFPVLAQRCQGSQTSVHYLPASLRLHLSDLHPSFGSAPLPRYQRQTAHSIANPKTEVKAVTNQRRQPARDPGSAFNARA